MTTVNPFELAPDVSSPPHCLKPICDHRKSGYIALGELIIFVIFFRPSTFELAPGRYFLGAPRGSYVRPPYLLDSSWLRDIALFVSMHGSCQYYCYVFAGRHLRIQSSAAFFHATHFHHPIGTATDQRLYATVKIRVIPQDPRPEDPHNMTRMSRFSSTPHVWLLRIATTRKHKTDRRRVNVKI